MDFNEEDMEKALSVVNEIKDKTLKFGGGMLFRGEEKVFPDPCSSSLFRRLDWEIVCPAGPEDTIGKVITNRLQMIHESLESSEEIIAKIFRNRFSLLMQEKSISTSKILNKQILDLLEIIGVQTNRINLTRSYLVALFFACYPYKDDYKKASIGAISEDDTPRVYIFDGKSTLQEKWGPRCPIEEPDLLPFCSIFPEALKRAKIQQIVFAYPREKGKICPLDYVTIPQGAWGSINYYLKKFHNISEETIFPDLIGIRDFFEMNGKPLRVISKHFGIDYTLRKEEKANDL